MLDKKEVIFSWVLVQRFSGRYLYFYNVSHNDTMICLNVFFGGLNNTSTEYIKYSEMVIGLNSTDTWLSGFLY